MRDSLWTGGAWSLWIGSPVELDRTLTTWRRKRPNATRCCFRVMQLFDSTMKNETCYFSNYMQQVLYNIEPHEAVPEVSRSKVHITQNKHVPIEIDCDFLNTFHSISHATLS